MRLKLDRMVCSCRGGRLVSQLAKGSPRTVWGVPHSCPFLQAPQVAF